MEQKAPSFRNEQYGDATSALQRIYDRWYRTDWFAPPRIAEHEAISLFEKHLQIAQAHAPETYAPAMRIGAETGGWAEFEDLKQLVSGDEAPPRFWLKESLGKLFSRTAPKPAPRWDWRFGALKPIARAFWEKRGFRHEDYAVDIFEHQESGLPPSNLFLRVGEVVVWNAPVRNINAIYRSNAESELGKWYLSYAAADVIDAAAWQLARGDSDTSANPFVPLLELYSTGYFPFVLGRDTALLFSFREGLRSERPFRDDGDLGKPQTF